MDTFFPTSLASSAEWAKTRGVSLEDAQTRFIQYAAIDSIAADPVLQPNLVFRGAAVLRLFYDLPRPTKDLDFIALDLVPFHPPSGHRERLHAQVAAALSRGMRKHFPDFEQWRDRLREAVMVQLSPNQEVCDTMVVILPTENALQATTLENVLAEKLVALLQQRNRPDHPRSQDTFDVAWAKKRYGNSINRPKVAEYFQRKAASRADDKIVPRIESFDEIIRERARAKYCGSGNDGWSLDFSKAWSCVIDFVSELPTACSP